MTRAELIAGLRARFHEVRSELPAPLHEAYAAMSDERVLLGATRCSACSRRHVSETEWLVVAAGCADMAAFIEVAQELCLRRYPERCRRKLDALEQEIIRESAAWAPS